MCSFGSFLEIYKIDKTFHVQSPDNIDPEQKNPNAMWVTTSTQQTQPQQTARKSP